MATMSACWLWAGLRDEKGYGFRNGPSRGRKLGCRKLYAHRLVYEALVGTIPAGLVLDHLCRVPGCVNPAHLEPVTTAENILRGECDAAVNKRKTHCKRGHAFDAKNTGRRRVDGDRYCKACSVLDPGRAAVRPDIFDHSKSKIVGSNRFSWCRHCESFFNRPRKHVLRHPPTPTPVLQ